MKRVTGILLIFLFSIFSLSAEDLDGTYSLAPFLIRLSDGRLIHPDKPYAYQYSGVVAIHFLQGSFARIETVDSVYDAFYKIDNGDSDNLLVSFTLRNGALFNLELVREEANLYRYYYTLFDPPFSPPPAKEEDPAIPPVPAAGEEGTMEPDTAPAYTEASVFSGVMSK